MTELLELSCFCSTLVITTKLTADRDQTVSRSNALRLQPAFQQCDLPKLGMTFRRQFAFGIGQQTVDIAALEQAALACAWGFQRVADEFKKRATKIFERRHREIAFRPIDHSVGD